MMMKKEDPYETNRQLTTPQETIDPLQKEEVI